MTKRINIGYIGYSPRIMNDIASSNDFNLACILCESDSLRQLARRKEMSDFAATKRVLYREFANNDELYAIICEMQPMVNHYLIYECNTIISSKITNTVSLYNLHPGDLRLNRGCHPIHWSILEGMDSTCMTLYKINSQIDLGIVVGVFSTSISSHDTFSSLQERLEKSVGGLLVKLKDYIMGETGECEIITSGEYKRKICPTDYTIDLNRDSLSKISAKIRSQSAYGGAVLVHNGIEYRVRAVYSNNNATDFHEHESNGVLRLDTSDGLIYAIVSNKGG